MKLFFRRFAHQWWARPLEKASAVLLLLAVLSGAVSTQVSRVIAPHNFQNENLAEGQSTLLKATPWVELETERVSFVQGGRGDGDIWVGLLDQEYIMQTSHALVFAFKRATQYIYSNGFVRQLYASNPFLKYSITSMEEKLKMVKRLEKIYKGSRLRYWNKPNSANKLLAESSLTRILPLRRRLFGEARAAYRKHFNKLKEALVQANAGSKALDMILASKTLPMYSWMDSFYNHPFKTIQNTIFQAFEDSVGGISGLFSSEVKSSCFSFAYRVNSIAPYSAVYPGGILGSIMKGLVRSYFLVFQQTLMNFKGVFALLIGVICRAHIIQGAVNAIKPLFRLARRGLRAVQVFKLKTIGMRGDPVGQAVLDRLIRREAVVLITILFQLHAVDVGKQYRDADNVTNALSGGNGAWSMSEGLFLGGAEFGRAFHRIVKRYLKSAAAYVQACEELSGASLNQVKVEDGRGKSGEASHQHDAVLPSELVDLALEFFTEAHPEESGDADPLTLEQKLDVLRKSCRKNTKFVVSYNARKMFFVQRLVQQMVRLLQYYFKYFKGYISEQLAIFYETALAMLDTKINESISAAEGVNSPAEEMAAAEARSSARRSAAQSAIEDRHLPRKLYRATKFADESQQLATGFFQAAGGFSLFQVAEGEADEEPIKDAALRLLTAAEASLRNGVGQIYKRFLNSQVLVAKLEKNRQRMSVLEFILKCHTPVQEKSQEEKETCGTIVTTELDEEEFIRAALFSVNLPIAGPDNDIAFNSTGQATHAFQEWADYALANRRTTAAHVARRNADSNENETLITHLREAVLEKLTFRRFEYVEGENKLILYDSSGRSLTFSGEPSPARVDRTYHGSSLPKPDPLDCTSRFVVRDGNAGTLEFFVAAGQRTGEGGETTIPRELKEVELKPAIALEGHLEYNEERKELAQIQDDPAAIRDTIVAHFVEKRGRVAAESLAGILCLLHNRLPIFWKRSPVEFIQHISPKMIFDAMLILSTQAYDQAEATVLLDGKLYTFPKSYAAIKDIILSSVNRAIVRLHSLNAADAALLITMGSLHFAYKKIQKHRTGRTSLMHAYLKEVRHIMEVGKTGLNELELHYPECTFFVNWEQFSEEDILKCALFRFMKLGSLQVEGDAQQEVQIYLTAFVSKLAEIKGDGVTWQKYLNLDYFLTTEKMYAKTTAKYKYETLRNQLNDVPGSEEEQSELEKLMKKLHPSLSGYKPARPKKKRGLLKMLVSLKQNFRILPATIRNKISHLWRNCYARLRRFFGSRRSYFREWRISPRVIQGPHFMGALKAAEALTYPDLDIPRQTFIEVQDLEEFGKVLLTLETIAATLDSPQAMYTTVTQLRSSPAFSPSAQKQHECLVKRARLLGPQVTKVAAGWVLKVAAGASGVNMALGLMALHDTSGIHMEKALQLRYLTSEALAFLESSLDLAYILMHAPQQTKEDVETMRFSLNHPNKEGFSVKAQCEPKGLGIDTARQLHTTDLIRRLEEAVEKIPGFAHQAGSAISQHCEQLVSETLRYDVRAMATLPHEFLVEGPEAFGLCYLLMKLRSLLAGGTTTTTLEDILQNTAVDEKPLAAHLQFLQQRSASQEDRKMRAAFISPMLKHLLVAAVENFSGSLGGISFRMYDGESKTLSFQYTIQDESPPGPPGETLAYAAELLLGANDKHKCRFIAFSFDGPSFLMDWYKYVDTKKLSKYVDDLRSNKETFSYKAVSKLSNVYVVTDLIDVAYSIRQSSKLDPAKVARKAAQTMLVSAIEPVLRRYGLANMLMELVLQAERVKKQCVVKCLSEYEAFSASTVLAKEMFKYDCFYTTVGESNAFADAVRNVTEEDVTTVLESIDKAYEEEAKQLYEQVIKSSRSHSQIASAAFKLTEEAPIISMVEPMQKVFLQWLREGEEWANVAPVLQAQRQTEWVATKKTTTLGRPVTSLEHPMLMNPYQLFIDVLITATTGSARRRRFPVLAPLKRLKALYAMVKPGKTSRREMQADLRERQEAAREAEDAYNKQFASVQ
ncbi:hypothetical protein Esti_006418 [Eimeria stiedai]